MIHKMVEKSKQNHNTHIKWLNDETRKTNYFKYALFMGI